VEGLQLGLTAPFRRATAPFRNQYLEGPSLALGFARLGVVGLQLGLTAPFRRATAPLGIDFWRDLALTLRFAGLWGVGLHFGLTASFRRATAPFGIDIIFHFHRPAALVGVALLLGHWWILLL